MRRRRVPWPLVALASLLIAWIGSRTDIVTRLEQGMGDAGASMLQHEIDSDVVIVAIDAKSIAELREWPWPRRHHAALIEKLAEAPPQQLFIDIDFSAASNPLDDQRLATAMAAWDGEPIILPAFFQYASASSTALVVTEPLDILRPHVAVASVNLEPDADGLVRSVRRTWSVAGRTLPAVAAALGDLAAENDAEIIIDYTISPSSFRVLSYIDIVANRTPAEYFADKTVFVGATAIELGDMVPVPVYQSLPGVIVQALAYESARTGNLRFLDERLYWLIASLFGLILGYWFCRQTWQRNVLVIAASMAAMSGFALYLYATFDLIIKIVPLAITVTTAYLLATLRSLESETVRAMMYAVGFRKREALLNSIVLSSTDCIVCIDADGSIRTANPAAASLFGCELDELVGASIFDFVPELTTRDDESQSQVFDRAADSILESNARTMGGDNFPVELSVSRVQLTEELLYTAIIRDISERKAQQQQLQFQATHDPLTSLPNRAAMAAHLDACLAQHRSDSPVALLMIDLDRFKEVNDTLGHNVGDYVLHEVARRLADVASSRGFLARIGGDEFALVIDQLHDSNVIAELSRDLADCLKKPIKTSGIAIEVGLSIGIARYPEDAKDAETLFKYSDIAMYSAKRNGAEFEFYDSSNDRHSVRKLTIATRLRQAITNSELELHYQPQVNLKTGRVDSVEALLRWEDAVLGAVNPAEFVELAEATDLIRPLSNWTLVRAFEQAVAWQDEELELRVAVNISARMLQDVGFPELIANLLLDIGVSPKQIELEITESAMMVDPQRALQVIEALSELGFLISVDDYGTGYSSLAYLRDLPVHALKVDKSFVLNLHRHAGNRVIVESTVQMAHALNLMVVAEGVETAADAEILRACGYDFGQGYLYSAALKPDALSEWIEAFNSEGSADQSLNLAQG